MGLGHASDTTCEKALMQTRSIKGFSSHSTHYLLIRQIPYDDQVNGKFDINTIELETHYRILTHGPTHDIL